MAVRKKLQDLTIKDNFMFAAVMMDPDNSRKMLELALGIEIDHIEVFYEKSIIYNPEYKGVRLDIYVKDDKNTRYNVEMQTEVTEYRKRSRYYHNQIDMELLESGSDYEELPETYVIFVCDNDPFGLGKYKYTVRKSFEQDEDFNYDDGSHTIFLSTVGNNDGEEPEELIKFLHFVGADLKHSFDDYDDEYVKQLQDSVKKVKVDREMRRRYMMIEEIKKKEYNAGKAEGIEIGKTEGIEIGKTEGIEIGKTEGIEIGKTEGIIQSIIGILSAKGDISKEMLTSIESIEDIERLQELVIKAASIESISEFQEYIKQR